MPLDITKYTKEKNENFRFKGVWIFIIVYSTLQFLVCLLKYNVLLAFLDILITWLPVLFIPCLLKYCFKVNFRKKAALLYTVCFSLLLLSGNCLVDLYIKDITNTTQTTTIWNLLMMITPYYLLTDEPMFTSKLNKTNNDIEE